MNREVAGTPLAIFLGVALSVGGAKAEDPPPPRIASTPIAYCEDTDRIYVANPDADSMTVVDADGLRKETEVPCGRDPRGVALGARDRPGGVRVFVTARRSGTITRCLAVPPFDGRFERSVGVEPWAILYEPSRAVLLVTDRAAGAVLWIDPESLAVRRRVDVGQRPTALAIAGDRLYVGHFHGGRVSVLDARDGKSLDAIALRSDAELVRNFALSPDGTRLFIPHTRCFTDAPDLLFDTMIFPFVSIVDVAAGESLAGIHMDAVFRPENEPVAAAVAPDGRRLLVVCAGSRTLAALDLRTGGAAGREALGEIPHGIAIDPGRGRAYVPCLLSNTLEVVSLDPLRVTKRLPLARSLLAYRLRVGKAIFHDGASPATTLDRWMSCATCHPDGEALPRTWNYRIGPRNVQALFGAQRTGPLFWSGTRDEIQDFEWAFRHFQAGRGIMPFRPYPQLGRANAGRWYDLDALAAYVASLEPAPSARRHPDGTYTREALRGRAVFFSQESGCAICHRAPLYTDSALTPVPSTRHDVGTGEGARERGGPAFDTPPLCALEFSAPYLHDGRAATLRDVVTTWNPGDRHGRTSGLDAGEIDDLCAFLASIPYVSEEALRPGDVDGDGDVDDDDAESLRRFLGGAISLTEAGLQNGDVDGDGRLTEADPEAISERVEGPARPPADRKSP
ncbi:MAG: hypothetical protein JXP34_27455 [Planctomycetes bacterium]|nr:hypothetical protein [Planctomycetota bacterium]